MENLETLLDKELLSLKESTIDQRNKLVEEYKDSVINHFHKIFGDDFTIISVTPGRILLRFKDLHNEIEIYTINNFNVSENNEIVDAINIKIESRNNIKSFDFDNINKTDVEFMLSYLRFVSDESIRLSTVELIRDFNDKITPYQETITKCHYIIEERKRNAEKELELQKENAVQDELIKKIQEEKPEWIKLVESPHGKLIYRNKLYKVLDRPPYMSCVCMATTAADKRFGKAIWVETKKVKINL